MPLKQFNKVAARVLSDPNVNCSALHRNFDPGETLLLAKNNVVEFRQKGQYLLTKAIQSSLNLLIFWEGDSKQGIVRGKKEYQSKILVDKVVC